MKYAVWENIFVVCKMVLQTYLLKTKLLIFADYLLLFVHLHANLSALQ